MSRRLRLGHRGCGFRALRGEIARLQHGQDIARMHLAICQQGHLRDRRGDSRTDRRFAPRCQRRDRDDLAGDRSALRFRDLHAHDDVRFARGSGAVTTSPDENDQKQTDDNRCGDDDASFSPPGAAPRSHRLRLAPRLFIPAGVAKEAHRPTASRRRAWAT